VNFLKIRKARKELKEVLHHAKHIRHMHEDIGDPDLLANLHAAEKDASKVRKGSDPAAMEAAGKELYELSRKVAPLRKNLKIRENVEVIFVAVAAAMAIRAYCFQPFKIPTGSMQPTLYGITLRAQQPDEMNTLPKKLWGFFARGELLLKDNDPLTRIARTLFIGPGYTVTAKNSGVIRARQTSEGMKLDYRDNFDHGKTITIFVGNTPHVISRALAPFCRYNEPIRAGESLFRGIAKTGDYILINRIRYNFIPPKRGDIVVFDAKDVTRDAYYIKRLVGLPGESISLNPPYLLANGKRVTDPRFKKIFADPRYAGYEFSSPRMDGKLLNSTDTIDLTDEQYLFFGDNTKNSLDGRYFGGVERDRILGSAFFVGLPLDRAGIPEIPH
jgi:signal peptidase I